MGDKMNGSGVPRRPTRADRRRGNVARGVYYTNASRAAQGFTPNAYTQGRDRLVNVEGVGGQYNGNRDIYTAAGYKGTITHGDILSAEQREHIATRIVSIFPEYTWREPPELIDGSDIDGSRDTPFCTEFARIWQSGKMTEDGETSIGLDYHLRELDRVAALGKYAVLFLGFVGEEDFSEPVQMGQFKALGVDALAYCQVYAEGGVSVQSWETDPKSRRYGKPTAYTLKSQRGNQSSTINGVHWTRVVHVALNGVADLVEGRSILVPVFNVLSDILKIVAGTGESGYRNADPGMVVSTQPAFEGPEAADDLSELLGSTATADANWYEETKQAVQAYIHGLERFMILEGYTVDMLTGDIPDPRGPIDVLMDLIAGATGIPKRLLLGNEAGELASTQDQQNWAAKIESRQSHVAEPLILRPVINRLIWSGVLPEPSDSENDYLVFWPSLYSVSPMEEAEVANKIADTLSKIGASVDPKLFAATYIPDLDPKAIIEGANLDTLPVEDQQGSNPFDGPQDAGDGQPVDGTQDGAPAGGDGSGGTGNNPIGNAYP